MTWSNGGVTFGNLLFLGSASLTTERVLSVVHIMYTAMKVRK